MTYLMTYTGKNFDLVDIENNEVDILDIAHALSRVSRYGGHLEMSYTVAMHSIGCFMLAEGLGLSKIVQLYSLVHDFSEGYVIDLPKPLKNMLPQYVEIEDRVMETIIDKLNLPPITEEEWELVKKIDNTMLYLEFEHLAKRSDYPKDYDHFELDIDSEAFMQEVVAYSERQNDVRDELIEAFGFLMATQDTLRVVNGDLNETNA